jgi:hypothetical protein
MECMAQQWKNRVTKDLRLQLEGKDELQLALEILDNLDVLHKVKVSKKSQRIDFFSLKTLSTFLQYAYNLELEGGIDPEVYNAPSN